MDRQKKGFERKRKGLGSLPAQPLPLAKPVTKPRERQREKEKTILGEEVGLELAEVKTTLSRADIRVMNREIGLLEGDLDKLEIVKFELSIVSHDFLKKTALQVDNPSEDPSVYGGVNYAGLGPIDPTSLCLTCYQNIEKCPGHLGYISLVEPIIHPLYRQPLAMVLQSVCNCCGRLLLSEEKLKKDGILKLDDYARLKQISTASVGLICQNPIHAEGTITVEEVKKLKQNAGAPGNLMCQDESLSKEQLDDKTYANTVRCTMNPVFEMAAIETTGRLVYHIGKSKKNVNKRTCVLPLVCRTSVVDGKKTKVLGALDILEMISPEDIKLMGFIGSGTPKDFILQSFPVISPLFRQPSYVSGTVYSDNLTTMYVKIVKFNNELAGLRETMTEDPGQYEKKVEELTSAIEHLIDNSEPSYLKGNKSLGGKMTSIKEKLQGSKENLIRNVMMGKRVNFAGRTVITGDTSLNIDQVGVPLAIARILTVMETVTPNNRDRLTALYLLDMVKHVNSRVVKHWPELKTRLLEIGDKVSRWLGNGDHVIINRQPTLSSESIMAFKARIHNDKTLKLHLATTKPFNADFDGDEMNIHVPQSEEAKKEASSLMSIENCLISSKNSQNTIGVVYDALVGAYLLTAKGLELVSKEEYFNLIMVMSITDDTQNPVTLHDLENRLSKYGIHVRSGYGLFSALLPADFRYEKEEVIIQDGVLIRGVMTKSIVGSAHNSIITALVRQYGQKRALLFLDDIYRLCNTYMVESGFSVGVTDCQLPEETLVMSDEERKVLETYQPLVGYPNTQAVKMAILDSYRELKNVGAWSEVQQENLLQLQAIMPFGTISDYNRHPEVRKEIQHAYMTVESTGTPGTNPIEAERKEKQIQKSLARTKGVGVRVTSRHLKEDNTFGVLGTSGARGGPNNTALITTQVGQLYVASGRIPKQLSGNRRVLPYDDYEDTNPETQGFITNSYIQGLDQRQNFLNMIPSREGLVSTASATSETGDMNRRMTRDLEDMTVKNDGSVRFGDAIIQYTYGYHGMDVTKMEMVNTKTGRTPSFINIKDRANYYNSKFGYSLNVTTTLLPYEQTIMHNDRLNYITDVGVRKVRLIDAETKNTELVDIDKLKKDTIKQLTLPPRRYHNQPITTLLPIKTIVRLDTDTNYETIVARVLEFKNEFLLVKSDEEEFFVWLGYVEPFSKQTQVLFTGILSAVITNLMDETAEITLENGETATMTKSQVADRLSFKINDIINYEEQPAKIVGIESNEIHIQFLTGQMTSATRKQLLQQNPPQIGNVVSLTYRALPATIIDIKDGQIQIQFRNNSTLTVSPSQLVRQNPLEINDLIHITYAPRPATVMSYDMGGVTFKYQDIYDPNGNEISTITIPLAEINFDTAKEEPIKVPPTL